MASNKRVAAPRVEEHKIEGLHALYRLEDAVPLLLCLQLVGKVVTIRPDLILVKGHCYLLTLPVDRHLTQSAPFVYSLVAVPESIELAALPIPDSVLSDLTRM